MTIKESSGTLVTEASGAKNTDTCTVVLNQVSSLTFPKGTGIVPGASPSPHQMTQISLAPPSP